MTRDGKLQAARVKSPLIFGGRGTKHLVSAKGEQGTSGLGVTRALPEPKISGNTITYPDAVAPGADLVVIAQGDGFVSQVVFRHKPTGPVTVRLPLTLPKGTTFGKTPQGLPQLKDAKGKAAAAPIVLTAMDAKVEAGPEQGKTSRVDAHVEISGATSELVFTPDAKFLADPTVTYPVTIAAASEWFGGGQPDDAWVNKNDPYSNHAADGWLRAGTTSTSADIARVYLWYDLDAPELEGATVVDADLIIWNYKSGGPNGALCGETLGSGIVAQRVTSYWDTGTLDWNHQPTRAGGTEGLNQAGYNYDASGTWCAKDEALWHQVKTMARAWIEQGVPNEGMVLRAYSETAAINWRQYYSSEYSGQPYPGYRHPPTLMVEYTPAPTSTVWLKFEGEDITDFPTYDQAKAMQSQPLDDSANWALSNSEADEIEALGQGVANEITSSQLQPLPDDIEVDPSELDPDELSGGELPEEETPPTALYASAEDGAPAGWLAMEDMEQDAAVGGNTALPINTWSHLALTYDGTTARLYVNGNQVGQVATQSRFDIDSGALRIGGNSVWGEYFRGLIDEVRVYNRAQTRTEIQTDMNTPIGAVPAPARAGLSMESADTAPSIAKLVVIADDEASATTPQFTAWVTDPQGRPTTVEVEVAREPAKSSKAKLRKGKLATTKELTWSGMVTGQPGVSRHTLRIPPGKLKKGQQMRWRARATVANESGAWSEWQQFEVGVIQPGDGSPTHAAEPVIRTDPTAQASQIEKPSASPAPTVAPRAVVATSDPNTSGPFDYQRLSLEDCSNERLKSPRPYHGFGWTVVHPYTACYSKKLGWGDWEVNRYTGLPKDPSNPCPKTFGIMMTGTVVMHTYLGVRKGGPVFYGEQYPGRQSRDISVWIKFSDIKTVGANCVPTTAHDRDPIQVRVQANGSDNSDCNRIKGADSQGTIGDLKRNGYYEFVFQSEGGAWGNCTLRPKLYPDRSYGPLEPSPFRLWQYLATENGPPTKKGDLPPVARCDSRPISFRYLPDGAVKEKWGSYYGACRFLGADRVYTMYTGDPHRGKVAQHIWDAFHSPQTTDPKVDDKGNAITKNFPGNYDKCAGSIDPKCVKVPLTRRGRTDLAPDGKKFDGKNSYLRRKYCQNLPGYSDPDKQCDEYPFASTHEAIGVDGEFVDGEWVPSLNASLRPLDTSHNGPAGRDLSAFYARYRVFTAGKVKDNNGELIDTHSNTFYVRVRTGAP